MPKNIQFNEADLIGGMKEALAHAKGQLTLKTTKLPKKSVPSLKRKSCMTPLDAEERSLAKFNRMIAKAAPLAARETAAALNRFHRGIAAEIRAR